MPTRATHQTTSRIALAYFKREVSQILGPVAWQRYAAEFGDLASIYDRPRWRREDYDAFQLIMLSIMDDFWHSPRVPGGAA